PTTGSPFATGFGSGPFAVTVDPSGKFAYVGNASANTVSAYKINSDGTLTKIGDFATGVGPVSVAVDPSGEFLYVTNFNPGSPGSVSGYAITPSAAVPPAVPGSLT